MMQKDNCAIADPVEIWQLLKINMSACSVLVINTTVRFCLF